MAKGAIFIEAVIPDQKHMILIGETRDIGQHFGLAGGARLGAAILADDQPVAVDAAGIVRRPDHQAHAEIFRRAGG